MLHNGKIRVQTSSTFYPEDTDNTYKDFEIIVNGKLAADGMVYIDYSSFCTLNPLIIYELLLNKTRVLIHKITFKIIGRYLLPELYYFWYIICHAINL